MKCPKFGSISYVRLAATNKGAVITVIKDVEPIERKYPHLGTLTNEYILCAAIYFQDGVAHRGNEPHNIETGYVILGRRHGDCYSIEKIIREQAGRERVDNVHGFLTSYNRFVTREEASPIARKMNQTTSELENLFSEDLY